MKKLIALTFFLIFPVTTIAGFPEGESGYDLEKLEKSLDYPVMKSVMMNVLLVHLVWEPVLGYLE